MSKLTWWFDLDNTLHNASHAIFPAINDNMNAYIGSVLRQHGESATLAEVNALRKAYLERYGATLLGLVRHYHVRKEEFLDHAHRFEDLVGMVRSERGLARTLARLPGRKILLTNAPKAYSRDIMRHLGLHRHFFRHIAIEEMQVHGRLSPKPSKRLMRKLMAQERRRGGKHILVEDTLSNLRTAKRLGMGTAWVTAYLGGNTGGPIARTIQHSVRKRPTFVDVKVKSVTELVHASRGFRHDRCVRPSDAYDY